MEIKKEKGKWLINGFMYQDYDFDSIERDVFDTRLSSKKKKLATPKDKNKKNKTTELLYLLFFALLTVFLLCKFNKLCQSMS